VEQPCPKKKKREGVYDGAVYLLRSTWLRGVAGGENSLFKKPREMKPSVSERKNREKAEEAMKGKKKPCVLTQEETKLEEERPFLTYLGERKETRK